MADELLNPVAVIGNNMGPPFDPEIHAKHLAKVATFADAGGEWLDEGKITSTEKATGLKLYVDGARAVLAEVNASFVEAKKPHEAALAAVRTAYATPIKTMEMTISRLSSAITDWVKLEKARVQREKDAEAAAAREREAEAARALEAAKARNDVAGEVAAAAAVKDAGKAVQAAAKPVKVTVGAGVGNGRAVGARKALRTVTVKNWTGAFMAVRDHPNVQEAIVSALNAKVRAKEWDGVIPGGCEVDMGDS